MRPALAFALGLVITATLACTASREQTRGTAVERAAFDLGCPAEQLSATQLGDTVVIGRSQQTAGVERTVLGVSGCGKKAVYVVECVTGIGESRCNAIMNADEKPAAAHEPAAAPTAG